MSQVNGDRARERPCQLTTPSGTSANQMYRDENADPPALVCTVGTTVLRYQLRCLDYLHAMLKEHGDWIPLGSADEQKPAAEGTVEAWPPGTRRVMMPSASQRARGKAWQ